MPDYVTCSLHPELILQKIYEVKIFCLTNKGGNMKKVLMTIFIAAGLTGLVSAQQGSGSSDANWEKIGQTTINLSEDYGIFDWDRDREESISANNKYSAIKFKAKDAKVNLSDIEVEYDNGKKENLKLGSAITPGSESKQLKLDTREDLDKVTIRFNKDESAASDKAVIEVWGLKEGHSGMGSRDMHDDDAVLKRDDDVKRDRDNNRRIDVDVDVDTTRIR